ncbi:hypothetical protein ACEPAI_1257 [Sanghuangporus weigelae]
MPTPKPAQRQRTASTNAHTRHSAFLAPRRAARAQRSSNSSNSSSGSSAVTLVSAYSNANCADGNKTLTRSLADFSPASEALSLTEETDVDEQGEGEDDGDGSEVGIGPEEWDEGWDFEPKPGDAVWVKSKDTERETWYYGHVQRSTRTGTVRGGKQGMFYSVRYHRNLRRYFAPLLEEIKPDTPRVRKLLEQAGCDLEL